MKLIVFMMLFAIGTMCFGCREDKEKAPPLSPTDTTTYLDVKNLWNMYNKDMQTVKDSLTAGAFVSQQDVQRSPERPVTQLLTYSKYTPAGKFIIECEFFKDTLIQIFVMPEKYVPLSDLQHHYMAISEDIAHFTDSNPDILPFKASYGSSMIYAKSKREIDPNNYKMFNGVEERRKYIKFFSECINNYVSIDEDNYHILAVEFWRERLYDPVIGCLDRIDCEGIQKNISVAIASDEGSKYEIVMSVSIQSRRSQDMFSVD